tara:strand:+ start:183 stop:455 length:273 start_codon:yes stop_codon:yes gene_type:complete
MSEAPETKFKVKVYNYPEGKKPKRVPKEVTESLKGVVSTKKIGKLKKEAIHCPVLDEERNFVECFSCQSFIRRVMGEVDCAGGSAELQIQ